MIEILVILGILFFLYLVANSAYHDYSLAERNRRLKKIQDDAQKTHEYYQSLPKTNWKEHYARTRGAGFKPLESPTSSTGRVDSRSATSQIK